MINILLVAFSLSSESSLRDVRLSSELIPIKSLSDTVNIQEEAINDSVVSPEIFSLRALKRSKFELLEWDALPEDKSIEPIMFQQRVQFEDILMGVLAQRKDLLPPGFIESYYSGGNLDERGLRILERLKKYLDIVLKAASEYDLDPNLLLAVITVESAGRASAISKAGAKGLMQLMDATAAILGVEDVFDPQQNIMGGAKYIREQFDRFYDWEKALAAYNAGPNAVKKYNGIPPYKETKNYVQKVMQNWRNYRSGSIVSSVSKWDIK